ncbi:MAG: hypothetical protein AAFU68_17355, partial [Pseudomonadota bacterium]
MRSDDETTIRDLRAQLDDAKALAADLEAELASSTHAVEEAVAEERRRAALDAETLRTTLEKKLRDKATRAQAAKAELEKVREALPEVVAAAHRSCRAELEQCCAQLDAQLAAHSCETAMAVAMHHSLLQADVLSASVARIDDLVRDRDEAR